MSEEEIRNALDSAKRVLEKAQQEVDELQALINPERWAMVLDQDKVEEDSAGNLYHTDDRSDTKVLAGRIVRDHIPDTAKLVFVGASPSANDAIYGMPISGPEARELQKTYIDPLGLKPEEIGIMSLVPIHLVNKADRPREPYASEREAWLRSALKILPRGAVVVSLGKTAHKSLGDRSDINVPHPRPLRKYNLYHEASRKVKKIRALLTAKDEKCKILRKAADELEQRQIQNITKADEVRQLVYGVVLEPETVDLQGDVISAEEIEKACHRYMENSRVIGEQHMKKLDAIPVECAIARTDFEEGGQVIKKGSWYMCTLIKSREKWESIKNSLENGGKDGYSIGAYGQRKEETA